jgi:O-antigen/teichoic acid export membrane protein
VGAAVNRLTAIRHRNSVVLNNVVARLGALASLGIATLIVARIGGPSAVGVYALLRVLPGLAGVLISAGLPGAVTYFLAGPLSEGRKGQQLRPTIVTIATVSGAVGTLLWVAGAPLLTRVFFRNLEVGIVAWAGIAVLTQLYVATVKSCLQGSHDLRGANLVIVLEELMFLPAYAVVVLLGVHGFAAIVAGLVLADVATAVPAWLRLARRGFFDGFTAPSLWLARQVTSYGIRGQIGGVMLLLNLRLDFAILGALAGANVLGTYAIASKFAELLKLPGMALTYVLYPRFTREGPQAAAATARAMMPRATAITMAAAVPLALAAGTLLPVVYGEAFRPAIVPAYILLVGLAPEGLAGVATGFLYGAGRPGLNSFGMGVGVAVTVALDVLLIPRFAATGAAIASTAAYLTSTVVLTACYFMVTRSMRLRDVGSATPARSATPAPRRPSVEEE